MEIHTIIPNIFGEEEIPEDASAHIKSLPQSRQKELKESLNNGMALLRRNGIRRSSVIISASLRILYFS